MEWQNGRQLSRATTERDSTTEDVLDFAYDANGIRTRKTVTRNTYRSVQTYKVTFVADGKTVKTMNVTEGYTLKDSDYPAVPTKSGYSGAWKPYTAAIHNDITINAVYTALKTKHTVIFFADGKALKTMQVDNGYTLKASDYPSIPEKDGYTGRWDTRVTRITKDTAIYAIYSNNSTHTVTFIFAEVERNTLTVADGYILKDSDYPVPLIPSKDPSAVAVWEKYTSPIHEDITVRGNWQGSAVLPTEPSYPDEIMSGGEGEPVEADVPAEDETVSPQGMHVTGTQTVTHEYLTLNGKVARETIKTNNSLTAVLDFIYDESGKPFALKYSTNGTSFETYYYVLNLQGDVVKLIHYIPGFEYESVATYEYDAWGNILSSSGRLAEINPLRYRGYYYDSETGFYYLQSRYYDPVNRRFINADSYASTGQGFIGTNMFAYCNNSPILFVDHDGNDAEAVGWWASAMWWLCAADGPLPVSEIIYGAGLVVLGCVIIDSVAETTDTLIEQFPSEENEASDNITSYREHTTTKNGKKRNKHEEGNARRKRDQGGEKKKQKPEWTSRNNKWRIVEEK